MGWVMHEAEQDESISGWTHQPSALHEGRTEPKILSDVPHLVSLISFLRQ